MIKFQEGGGKLISVNEKLFILNLETFLFSWRTKGVLENA